MDKEFLFYTFHARFNLTYSLLNEFKHDDVDRYFLRNLGDVQNLVDKVLSAKYDFILGLGDFRKDAKHIRIEKGFINKYGRNKIIEDGQEFYEATWRLPGFENCYYSDKASNGPCNRSGYLLSKLIADNELETKLAFVHVPSKFDLEKVKKMLNNWIESLLV